MLDNLKTRILVILLGVPGQLLLIWWGGIWFSLFVLIVMLISAFEFSKLTQQHNAKPSVFLLFIALSLLFLSSTKYAILNITQIFILFSVTVFLFEMYRNQPKSLLNIASTLFGFVWIGLLLGSVLILRQFEVSGYNIGFELTLSMFVTVWACDSAAYLCGKQWGKAKVSIRISPNKTWIGCISGVIAAIVTMLIFYYWPLFSPGNFFVGHLNLKDVLILALIYGIVGQAGDFAESLLKREAKIKDSGQMLKGHGGVLDRFDSLTFTAPLALIYVELFIN